MTRTLITGINGFTGRYLAARLAADGHEIHGLVHQSGEEHASTVTEIHVASILDKYALTRIISQIQPNFIVHLAAIAFVQHNNVDQIYSTNLIGTRNILQATVDAEIDPSALLLASSANVYGASQEGTLDERASTLPANDYGVSKLAMEHISRLFADKLPIILVRPFNYTGVGQSLDFVIPKIVDHARRRAVEIELGNIDVARDFSDVRVVADSYAQLLEAPSALGSTFNVCSGRAYTLRDIIAMIERISGHSFEIRINPAFIRSGEPKILCGDGSLLENMIGRVSMPPMEETLRWMLEA